MLLGHGNWRPQATLVCGRTLVDKWALESGLRGQTVVNWMATDSSKLTLHEDRLSYTVEDCNSLSRGMFWRNQQTHQFTSQHITAYSPRLAKGEVAPVGH